MKILHLGNVANNAYVNAKILNQCGYDCDVISYDYYHAMATPEWEDAIFRGPPPDSEHPDWNEVELLEPMERPPWFFQGPVQHCIEAALARRKSSSLQSKVYQALLREQNRLHGIQKKQQTGSSVLRRKFTSAKIRILRNVHLQFASRRDKQRESYNFDQKVDELIESYAKLFPDRSDRLSKEDLSSYRSIMPSWIELFSHYDLVQAYGMEPIIPLLAGKKYVAFEHGTIRHRPWQDTVSGRLIAIAYAMADAIHMTNADSIYEALRLNRSPNKIIKGLHGLDPNRIHKQLEFQPKRSFSEITGIEKQQEFRYFFAPARQNWELKGNDTLLYAVTLLKQQAPHLKFKVLVSDWGQDVLASKTYIKEQGLQEYFLWLAPLSKTDLIQLYSLVDAVFDQFQLPAMGGIAPEVMAIGRAPCVTRIEQSYFNHFYGENIPLVRANNELELAEVIKNLVNDRQAYTQDVRASKSWFDTHHSREKLIANNERAYHVASTPSNAQRLMAQKASGWRFLNNPYPYKGALSFSTDCEFLAWPEKLKLFRLLNGPKGLGLEISDSLFFYATHSMCHSSYSYFKGDQRTPQAYAPLIHEMNQAGYIDTVHAFGDFDRGGFTREHAERAFEVCQRESLKFEIYSNHGSNQNYQNMGHLQLQNYQGGDNPESPYYHADLLDQIGVRYYWVDDGFTPQPHYGNTLYTRLCRDKVLRNFFRRYRGLPGLPAPNAGQLHLQVTKHDIDLLCDLRKNCVYYQHLGVDGKNPDGTFTANKEPFFGDEAMTTLEYLAQKQSDGDLLVASSGRLLNYLFVRERLSLAVKQDTIDIQGDFSLSDLNGISLVGPLTKTSPRVTLNGETIANTEYVLKTEENQQILYFPWRRLEVFQW